MPPPQAAITDYDSLPDEGAKHLADDLIDILARASLTKEFATPAIAKKLFDHFVFGDGWGVTWPIPPPPKTLSPRSGALIMVPVGCINFTIPVTKAAMAKGGSKVIRQPGSPAYMKPNIAFDTSSVLFLYCDAGGSNIAQEHIDFFDHYNLDEAKYASVVAWDSQERTRIHGHNMKWVVFWTRLRLARYLADRNMQAPTNLVQWTNVQVESKEIVQLRLCIDILTKQAAFTAAAVEKIGATRGGGITLT